MMENTLAISLLIAEELLDMNTTLKVFRRMPTQTRMLAPKDRPMGDEVPGAPLTQGIYGHGDTLWFIRLSRLNNASHLLATTCL